MGFRTGFGLLILSIDFKPVLKFFQKPVLVLKTVLTFYKNGFGFKTETDFEKLISTHDNRKL